MRAATEPDPSRYAWWLAARSAGIVAFLLIAASVALGLALACRFNWGPGVKRNLVKVHQQIALAGIVAIGAHGLFLLGDKWLKAGITGIAIPFTIGYRPLWTSLGIIAGYLALLLGPTFYMRRRIGARRWRRIHQATVIVYLVAVLHALGSGTDGASLWFDMLVAATWIPIAVLMAMRYSRARKRAVESAARRQPSHADAAR